MECPHTSSTQTKHSTFVWFYFLNLIFLWIIGYQYLQIAFDGYGSLAVPTSLNELDSTRPAFFAWFLFLILTYIGYLAVFLLPAVVLTAVLTFMRAPRFIITVFSIIIAGIVTAYLIADARIYSIYHYHINGVILKMIFSGDVIGVFDFSILEWLMFGVGIVGIILFESCFMFLAAKLAKQNIIKAYYREIVSLLVFILAISLQIFFYASRHTVFGMVIGALILLTTIVIFSPIWFKYVVKRAGANKLLLGAIPIMCLLVTFILGAALASFSSRQVLIFTACATLAVIAAISHAKTTNRRAIVFLAMTCGVIWVQMFVMEYVASMRQIVEASYLFPFYDTVTRYILALSRHENNFYSINNGFFMQPKGVNANFQYPLQALQQELPKTRYNVVMLIIDTWRYDMANADVTPEITKFAQQAWQYQNHWSGGNATQAGMFSLFYGLPSNYWTASLNQKKGPLLIKEMLKNNYKVGVFSSSELAVPALYKTVFQDVPNLKIMADGDYIYIRDQNVNQEFHDFLTTTLQNKQNFFSVLFYDGAHGYCALGNPIHKFQPEASKCGRFLLNNDSDPTFLKNRYKNALYKIDSLIGGVINELKANDLLATTVVIIAGDHGEEFNDNHLNYWEHASNYTKYQVQTPLIMYWPNQKAKIVAQRTSHFDVAPTILKNVLGVKNASSDYSVGNDLLGRYQSAEYLVIGSYNSYGIAEAQQVTMLMPDGTFNLFDPHYRPLSQHNLNGKIIKMAMQDMVRFYLR